MADDKANLILRIIAAADSIGFPAAVAVEQLRHESANFRNDVVYGPFIGGAGEKGVAQFIPGTWSRFGRGNPYDPQSSIEAWANYISYLSNMFGGDLSKILMAYNGGEGNVQRNTVSSRARSYAQNILARAQSQSGQFPSGSNPGSDPDAPAWIPDPTYPNISFFGLSPFASIMGILAAGAFLIFLAADDT